MKERCEFNVGRAKHCLNLPLAKQQTTIGAIIGMVNFGRLRALRANQRSLAIPPISQ